MATRPAPRAEASLEAPLALVAGSGTLPLTIAATLVARGAPPYVLAVAGEADASAFPGCAVEKIAVEEIGDLLRRLRRAGIGRCVLAGGVARRPALHRLRPSLGLLRILPRAVRALRRGDDHVLRTIIQTLEEAGIKVLGAQDIVPELVADEGLLAGSPPGTADWRDIEAGLAAARAIGALDIGQAAVAIGGRAIALEAIEGTDGLLERVASLRGHGRLAGRSGGVLVKCAKPRQELRADLPAIGPATMDAAAQAGLSGIALEAGRCFILDRKKALERAEQLKLFVIGVGGEDAS